MLNIYDKYNPNANPANTDYPNGSGKDESVEGANDGTPLEMDWYNDMLGFSEALLTQGRLTPSGNADTALVSDRLDAFRLAALRVQTACDYTGGDLSLVDVIYVGLDVTTVEYVIDRNTLTCWSIGTATGTVTADSLNVNTGVLSGVTGALLKVDGLYSIYQYVVSQYASGDKSLITYIDAGVDVSSYTYFIFKTDGRLYKNDKGVTGTLAGAFNPVTGTDPGVTGSLTPLYAVEASEVFGINQDWETAELTDTGALFADGTAKYRVTGGTYTNPYNKPLFISIYALASAGSASIRVDGTDRFTLASNATGTLSTIIPPLASYQLLGTDVVYNWNEDRPNGN